MKWLKRLTPDDSFIYSTQGRLYPVVDETVAYNYIIVNDQNEKRIVGRKNRNWEVIDDEVVEEGGV